MTDGCIIAFVIPFLVISSFATFHYVARLLVSYQIRNDALSLNFLHIVNIRLCDISSIEDIGWFKVSFPLHFELLKGRNDRDSPFSVRLCNRIWGNVMQIHLRRGIIRQITISPSESFSKELYLLVQRKKLHYGDFTAER